MRVEPNALFYGDNLDILQKHFDAESVDLIYLDPPFNSNATYNVLFKEVSGVASEAQLQAFSDFWHWDEVAERTYVKLQERADAVSDTVVSLVKMLGRNDMSAYLVTMAIRLVELRKVLKRTGSLYLHCDPTASHYLKILLDVVFNPRNFRNEIIWKRTSAHNDATKCGAIHDTILFYTKSDEYVWHPKPIPLSEDYKEEFLDQYDEKLKKWYKRADLTGAGITKEGESGKPWRGIDPTKKGRHWAYTHAELDRLDKTGRIHWPKSKDGMPRQKVYEDELDKMPIQDIWTDKEVKALHNLSQERTGFQTQKPTGLLKRIIEASSDEGQIVLDPFCGCGTTIIAASELKRKWFGIDVTNLAITLIKSQLRKNKVYAGRDYQIIGEPTTLTEAEGLAKQDKFQFEWWAISLLDATPSKPSADDPRRGTKGAEGGVDGWLTFREGNNPELERVVIQAKGGEHIGAGMVRDLKGAMDSKKAKLGVLITLFEPTEPMRQTAREFEYYESPTWGQKYPRVQIITVGELLSGKRPLLPTASGGLTASRTK